MLTKTNYND
jgi:hypothetical protein